MLPVEETKKPITLNEIYLSIIKGRSDVDKKQREGADNYLQSLGVVNDELISKIRPDTEGYGRFTTVPNPLILPPSLIKRFFSNGSFEVKKKEHKNSEHKRLLLLYK